MMTLPKAGMLLDFLAAYTKYQRLLRPHAALAIMNVNAVQYMHTENEADLFPGK